MQKSKTKKGTIIDFPARAAAVGEDNAFWMIAVSSCLTDNYSCEYDTDHGWWKLTVKASSFQGAELMVEKCRHILGWDKKETANVNAN